MYNIEKINGLEKYYFERLIKIFEKNGTTFFKNLTSQYLFNEIEENYSGKSVISDVMERVVQSIISNHTDWDIFSHPASSDSSFLTPKAVIHIDCKSTLDTDGDALQHKVDLGKNQTSYGSNPPITLEGIPFKSNLPTIYNHQLYGQLITLTYIVKIVYNLQEGITSLRNFQIYLCSVPNGLLQPVLGEGFINAGRKLVRPILQELSNEQYLGYLNLLDDAEKNVFNNCYYLENEANVYKLHEWINNNTNSLAEPLKSYKKSLNEIYLNKNFNVQREKLRVKFLQMPMDDNDQYKWNRYLELTLK
jgi:hypothetical protein